MRCNERIQSEQQGKRAGFTLIELLVVISIIAILSALLLGGIQAARLAVIHAKAAQDINNLKTALATFHAEFGGYPPSSFALYANSTGDPSWRTDTANPQRLAKSRAIISDLFPSFTFTGVSGLSAPVVEYNGAECLVLFLGGVISAEGVPRGFSANPASPFKIDNGKRVGPFMEFDLKRLQATTNGKLTYLDSYLGQTVPIWYLSAYNGRGYSVPDPSNASLSHDLPPGMRDCYRQVFSMDHNGTNWSVTSEGRSKPAWKENAYQLISPGKDGVYGLGGYYADGMPQPKQPTWIGSLPDWNTKWGLFQSNRQNHPDPSLTGGDQDNITNFATRLN